MILLVNRPPPLIKMISTARMMAAEITVIPTFS
jgi:hypothetical protein